jgi:very-short-patch-repair endonuclease
VVSRNGVIEPERDPALKDRVVRLMKFLGELVAARSRAVLDVDKHEQVIWLDLLPEEVEVATEEGRGGVVLCSRRVSLEPAPPLPESLADLVIGDVRDSSACFSLSTDDPELLRIFEEWRQRWDAWASTDRLRRPLAKLHRQLQEMMQELGARPESMELVLCSGMLKLPAQVAGERVQIHIVSTAVTLECDEQAGDVLVRLSADGSTVLEDTQLLTGLPVYDSSGSRVLAETLAAEAASPLDDVVGVFLKEWADRALTVQVSVDGDQKESAEESLSLSPALVLRKRGSFALKEYYARIIRDAERPEAMVPLGLAQLVEAIEPDERLAWLERTGAAAAGSLAEDPLFPLPANPEQREILDRLGCDSGVVVEGPPGTGKTHTIANLVSALLARGQRVLVTSEKAQALRVLRDKLPTEMQQLCVSITDVTRGGSAELSSSVAEIAARKASFSPQAMQSRIGDIAAKRDQARQRRAILTEQIRAIREAETYQHPPVAPGYSGTLARIAERVVTETPSYDWLSGPLYGEQPPLDVDSLRTLIRLTAGSTPVRRRRMFQVFPDLAATLPAADELYALCNRARRTAGESNPEAEQVLAMLDGADAALLAELRTQCERLSAAVADFPESLPEVSAAADSLLSGQTAHLWSKVPELDELLVVAVEGDRAVGSHVVQVPVTGRQALYAYSELAAVMGEGAEWRSRFRKSPQQKAVEGLGPVAAVDGAPSHSAAAVRLVAAELRTIDAVQSAGVILSDLGLPLTPSGSRSARVNALHQAVAWVHAITALAQAARTLEETLRRVNTAAPRIRSVASARSVSEAAHTIAVKAEAARAQARLDQIRAELAAMFQSGPSPESDELLRSVDVADHAAIAAVLLALRDAAGQKSEEEQLKSLATRLREAAPSLATMIEDTAADSAWMGRIDCIDSAWAWQRARSWVLETRQAGRDKQLEDELAVCEADIARLTAQLAAEQAWLGCLRHMTAGQMQALQAYRDHIASIGKGSGKHAERFRQSARNAMQQAQDAVPAWVMPLTEVLAAIPPEPNSFDVVIVDEASQADVASTFLLWLAPRVIVVGDDKQCAPSDVSSGALAPIFEKLDLYLHDLPIYLRDSLTPRSSMFSMLRTRFGQVVRLREHFRCMPEIINWSSHQFYRDAPLIPLRQFGADRLPPLRTTLVEGAFADGRNATIVNRVEATALVEQLQACLADPAYDGKTFGVVVLQGQKQVDVIRNELLGRIDPETREERRLRVGTPPDFQGDERQVVFLSMVAAPGQKFMAMTRNEHQRRFNVAASRAQDQLWLFHSMPADLLRGNDLRHSLLTYMQSVSPAPADRMPDNVSRDERHPGFDSLFEQRVYLDIVSRGYHVNPQVEVNSRRIDLVVTGAAGRLAVECDGDAFHSTPEQCRLDLERERELVRCGWRFWRVRESEYYLDPVAAMHGLWDELDRRGISPNIVAAVQDSTASTWTPAELPNDESLAEDRADDDAKRSFEEEWRA